MFLRYFSLHMTHEDPRWYGAWWIGVLGCGLVSCLLSIPIFGFSRELPGKAENRKKDVDEAHHGNVSIQLSYSMTNWESFKHQLRVNSRVVA